MAAPHDEGTPTARKCYYIAIEDLKSKYKERRNGFTRIKAYSRAIELATKKIGEDYYVNIDVEEKQGSTIQFTVSADSRDRVANAVQHIQGEFCDASVQYYDDAFQLPSARIRGIKGPSEAKNLLSKKKQQILQGEHEPVLLTEEALRKHDIKHMTGPCELRQFACGPCDHPWWRLVPVSKKVSRCRECHIRYDALPRNKEFGIGRFICTKPSCKRVFYAKCQASDKLTCRKCKTMVKHPYIHPRWRKRRPRPPSRPRSRQGRSLNPSAPTFVPRSPRVEPSFEAVSLQHGFNNMSLSSTGGRSYFPSSTEKPQLRQEQLGSTTAQSKQPVIAKPAVQSKKKTKVINASRVHNPSGSTVSTFITQVDETESVDLDYNSDEEGVGACRFECDCGSKYTVLCEMTDTAMCYNCKRENEPMGWAPPRSINKETENPHSCSKCGGNGQCPNLLSLTGKL